ncbi:MAG: integrase domain-containing protein [Betaproteobacteria bacterium]|nr:integrase domain-containing protein [Betaproteobacteria bacterium]
MQTSVLATWMQAALNQGKKSTRTREERHACFVRLQAFAKERRFHDLAPASITRKQISQYIAHLQQQGVSPRSLQNQLSHIRAAMRGAGMASKADSPEWSNASLGIASRPGDRVGKHRAVTESELTAAQAHAGALGDRGMEFIVLSALQRCLGLRAQEAIQAAGSLAVWERCLAENRPITVSEGTKGGRTRTAIAPDSLRERALIAVRAAQDLAQRHAGKLVDASSLKAARDRYRHTCAACGLVGDVASHGLRYAWAQDRYRAYRLEGFEPAEAVRRLSEDLGHGSGRGRYVRMVYLRGMRDEA